MPTDEHGDPYHYDVIDDLPHFSDEKLERMYRRFSRDLRAGDVPEEDEEEFFFRMMRIEEACRMNDIDTDRIAREVQEEADEWEDEWPE